MPKTASVKELSDTPAIAHFTKHKGVSRVLVHCSQMLRLRTIRARAASSYVFNRASLTEALCGGGDSSTGYAFCSRTHAVPFSAQPELAQEPAVSSPDVESRPFSVENVESRIAPRSSAENIETVLSYHDRTKHTFERYAAGPSGLDWDERPKPFRRYVRKSQLIHLRHLPPIYGSATDQQYSRIFSDFVNPSILTKASVSQLMYDSFSISAWKKAGPKTWPLRLNPSSGNLHPTEVYIVSPPLAGVGDLPFIAHYTAKEHAMEIRAELPFDLWQDLTKGFPPGVVFVAFSSIFWRQAWKYGERAYRYCQHDLGHAIGALAMAGCCMGWDSVLLDGWGNQELDHLLGLAGRKEMPAGSELEGFYPQLEQEHAHCLIALHPGRAHQETNPRGKPDFSSRSRLKDDSVYKMSNVTAPAGDVIRTIQSRMAQVEWRGKPNPLSKEHIWWDVIDKAASAAVKPSAPMLINSKPLPQWISFTSTYLPLTCRQVLHKRRSAVAMDSKFVLQREAFYQMMWKAMPSGYNVEVQGDQHQFPFRVLPWKAELHMAVFVHKVVGLPKGLYFLIRNSDHSEQVRKALRPEFQWETPEKCPQHLPLYLLAEANCETLAKQVFCHQDMAGDGCFSVAMIARFESITEKGAWMYPRLFWESGVLGQLLYLEAHAVGISASGMGCYFDDPVHQILGLKGKEFQSIYHFTVGSAVDDKRIWTLDGYPAPDTDTPKS